MPLTAELASLPFCCGETEGDKDLEDFFHHNALLYAQERLGKTYCFVNNEGEFSEIVAFFTVSNDSVKTTFIPKPSANKVQRTIPGSSRPSLPLKKAPHLSPSLSLARRERM